MRNGAGIAWREARAEPVAGPGAAGDYAPISDYALIGDCRTAALVSRGGSIDWLCVPRFDSPAVFAAILDARRGGRFAVRPAGPFAVRRRYLGASNVLETTFETPRGVARLTDAMPVAADEERRGELWPEHEVLRRLEVVDGEVEVEVLFDPRPDFGRGRVRVRDLGRLGLSFDLGGQVLLLRADLPLRPLPGGGGGFTARETLSRGERRYLSMVTEDGDPAVVYPLGEHADFRLERSRRYWEGWISRHRYAGDHPEAVARSLLALKLLTYAPSGALVAAPTTSLPEAIGGPRNWDYRYCWLRDASWTLEVLFDAGFAEEGRAFLGWLLHATRLTQPELQVIYDVHGGDRLPESTLPELSGYAGSRPVRVGNDASRQLQLDIYGEVVEAAYQFVARGGRLDRAQGRLLAGLGETVCRRWREPDEGIWEKRSGRFQHTYSKAMCWLALDRLLELGRRGVVRVRPEPLAREREAIRREIESRGWRQDLGSYTAFFGSDEVDANLLLLGIYGFADPASPRQAATFERVRRELGAGSLLYRYLPGSDGLPGGEGAFGICGFWAVEHLALAGRIPEAEAAFADLLGHANDVGLYSEQIDPATGAALGNFPQAFTHVGLVSAALTLAERTGRSAEPPAPAAGQKTGAKM